MLVLREGEKNEVGREGGRLLDAEQQEKTDDLSSAQLIRQPRFSSSFHAENKIYKKVGLLEKAIKKLLGAELHN